MRPWERCCQKPCYLSVLRYLRLFDPWRRPAGNKQSKTDNNIFTWSVYFLLYSQEFSVGKPRQFYRMNELIRKNWQKGKPMWGAFFNRDQRRWEKWNVTTSVLFSRPCFRKNPALVRWRFLNWINKKTSLFFSLLIKTHLYIQLWQVFQFKSVKFHDLSRLILTIFLSKYIVGLKRNKGKIV